MKKNKGVLILLLCMAVGLGGCNSNAGKKQTRAEKRAEKARLDSLRKAIGAEYKSKRIADVIFRKVTQEGFNGNVLVAQKDIVLYQEGSGMANIADSTRLSNDSKFQLASLSKTFTSIATLKLVEKGQLSLTTTVDEIYPNFPYPGVTIHSLLCHRSGLPYYEYLMDKEVQAKKWYPTNEDMMQWFANQNPTPKAYNLPDHFFSYNNTNFAILGAIIEKVSKMPFDTFLRQEILLPLEMNDTFANTTENPNIQKNRTKGYERNNREVPYSYYDKIVGDKGIYSTTGDLFKWYKGLRDAKILSKELLQEAFTPRSFEYPGLRNYGYGFRLWVDTEQRTDYVYHTGWWKGYNTIMFFDLREDFVIILLTNKLNRTVYHIKEIIDILNDGKKTTTVEENILDA